MSEGCESHSSVKAACVMTEQRGWRDAKTMSEDG